MDIKKANARQFIQIQIPPCGDENREKRVIGTDVPVKVEYNMSDPDAKDGEGDGKTICSRVLAIHLNYRVCIPTVLS